MKSSSIGEKLAKEKIDLFKKQVFSSHSHSHSHSHSQSQSHSTKSSSNATQTMNNKKVIGSSSTTTGEKMNMNMNIKDEDDDITIIKVEDFLMDIVHKHDHHNIKDEKNKTKNQNKNTSSSSSSSSISSSSSSKTGLSPSHNSSKSMSSPDHELLGGAATMGIDMGIMGKGSSSNNNSSSSSSSSSGGGGKKSNNTTTVDEPSSVFKNSKETEGGNINNNNNNIFTATNTALNDSSPPLSSFFNIINDGNIAIEYEMTMNDYQNTITQMKENKCHAISCTEIENIDIDIDIDNNNNYSKSKSIKNWFQQFMIIMSLKNKSITHADFIECQISGMENGIAIGKMLKTNKSITSLNLEGNCLGNSNSNSKNGKSLGIQGIVDYYLSQPMTSMTDFMGNNGSNLKMLNLEYNKLGIQGIIILSRGIAKNETLCELNISDNNISGIYHEHHHEHHHESNNDKIDSRGVEALAMAISKNKTLKILHLADNDLNSDLITIFVDQGLKFNHSLEVLNVARNSITGDGIIHMCENLFLNANIANNLTYLNVEENNLGCKGCHGIAQILDSSNENKLTSLNVNGCNLTDMGEDISGFIALGQALSSNTTLLSLDIADNILCSRYSNNNINTSVTTIEVGGNVNNNNNNNNNSNNNNNINKLNIDGIVTLMTGLVKNKKTKLKYLNLSMNELQHESAMCIASMLNENTVIEQLNLSECNLGNHNENLTGLIALVKSLKKNKHLISMNIGDNQFTGIDCDDMTISNILKQYLPLNKTLKYLDLSNNGIAEDIICDIYQLLA